MWFFDWLISKAKTTGTNLIQQGKEAVTNAVIEQGRKLFNPSFEQDIASQILDTWFETIFLHPQDVKKSLAEKNEVEQSTYNREEVIKVYTAIETSLPALTKMYSNFKINPNREDYDKIEPLLAKYLTGIYLNIVNTVKHSQIQYWDRLDSMHKNYIEDKKKIFIKEVASSLYQVFNSFELDTLNPENDQNLPRLINTTIKTKLINPNFNDQLVLAAADNNDPSADKLKQALGLFADVNGINKNKMNALQAAVIAGNVEQVKILLAAGAKPNIAVAQGSWKGCTPLHIAVHDKNDAILKLLLEYKADVNIEDKNGMTALQNAVITGDAKQVKQLLKAGAKPNIPVAKGNRQGWSLLNIALDQKNDAIVKLLLDYKADFNVANNSGITPIQDAVIRNDVTHVKWLLKAGAQANEPVAQGSWKGWSPIHIAAYEHKSEILNLLIEHKADPSKTLTTQNEYDGHTPLSLALLNPVFKRLITSYKLDAVKQYDCIKLLCDNQANVNQSVSTNYTGMLNPRDDWRGWSPLAIAVHNWHLKIPVKVQVKIIQQFIVHNADPNLAMQGNKDKWENFTPMQLLTRNKHNIDPDTQAQIKKVLECAQNKNDAVPQLKVAANRNGFFAQNQQAEFAEKKPALEQGNVIQQNLVKKQ